MSSALERGTSVNGFPVAGERLSAYSPFTGATQWPPMKLSYRELRSTGLPVSPGAA